MARFTNTPDFSTCLILTGILATIIPGISCAAPKITDCFPDIVESSLPPQKPLLQDNPSMYHINMLAHNVTAKKTQLVEFGYNGVRGFAKYTAHNEVLDAVFDYDHNQIMTMTNTIDMDVPLNCKVTPLPDKVIPIFELGLMKSGHPQLLNETLRFSVNWPNERYVGKQDLYGIPAERWVGCRKSDTSENLQSFEAYVMVNETWEAPVSRRTVPLGFLFKEYDSATKKVVHEFEYEIVKYLPDVEPNPELFIIPEGVYCYGMKGRPLEFTAPEFFSFDNEFVVDSNVGVGDTVRLVTYMKEAYDHKLKIYKAQYIELEEKTQLGKTKIHDFNVGLQYVVDEDSGTCKVKPIPTGDGDVEKEGNKFVALRGPASLLYLQGNWTFYHKTTERGLPVEVYKREYAENNEPVQVYEYVFAEKTDEFQGAGIWTSGGPVKIVVYTPGLKKGKGMTFHSIFNFDQDEPNVLDYDITTCYPPDTIRHFIFHLKGRYDLLSMPSLFQFKRQVLATLVAQMMVNPLRIHDIQLDVGDSVTYVTFTLLERPTVDGDVKGELVGEFTSADAIELLRSQMDSNKVLVATPGAVQGVEYLRAMAGSLSQVERTYSKVVESSTGYSSGSMAGLGIGMIVLGLALGTGGMIVYSIYRGSR